MASVAWICDRYRTAGATEEAASDFLFAAVGGGICWVDMEEIGFRASCMRAMCSFGRSDAFALFFFLGNGFVWRWIA